MKTKKTLKHTLFIFTILFIIVMIFGYLSTLGQKETSLFGYKLMRVTSDSMEPSIVTNSLVIVRLTSDFDIKKGDIICYKYDGYIIHRVVEVGKKYDDIIFITKGDNNKENDNLLITNDRLVGKVVKTMNFTKPLMDYLCVSDGEFNIEKLDTFKLVDTIMICSLVAFVVIQLFGFIFGKLTNKLEEQGHDKENTNDIDN